MEIINLKDVLKNHVIDDDFVRADFLVRLMAIENHYGKNDFGIDLYNRMQKHKGARSFNKGKKSFVHIIKSFESDGFISEDSNYILLNKYGRLAAGAHRIACCIYFGIDKIPCEYDNDSKKDTIRDIKWFKDKKFGKLDISRIIAKQEEILNGSI